jgi:hypothetical protein
MRALFRRLRQTDSVASDVFFDEARGQVCDTACRATAAAERSRTHVLLFR